MAISPWESFIRGKYIPNVPLRDVKVCIVMTGIDKLKPVRKLTAKDKTLFNHISDELYHSIGVKLRSMGNLQEWETRGVLLLDPGVIPSRVLTRILLRLRAWNYHKDLVLVGKSAKYAPLFRDKEEVNTVHVYNHPMLSFGQGSLKGSGIFKLLSHIDWSN